MNEIIQQLQTGMYYVVQRLPDGSAVIAYTTLDNEVFRGEGVTPQQGKFYDFHKHKFVKMWEDAISIEVYADASQIREVDIFANSFI